MKSPKIMYVLIGLFCVFALIAGIYAQFIENGNTNTRVNTENNSIAEKDSVIIKEQFNNIFTNTVNLNEYDTKNIVKIDDTKEIVYTVFDINRSEDHYELKIKVPVMNMKNDVANSFNEITQAVFVNRASEIIADTKATKKTIYTIDYVGFVNGDILSVIIRSTLKQANSAQRVIVQTYNYNLATGQKVSLTDMITYKVLNKDDVNKKIKEVIKEADEESKAIQNMGYNEIYTRNLDDEKYTVDGSVTYFLGPNSELYILYPYGNNDFTSEMDIVLFE